MQPRLLEMVSYPLLISFTAPTQYLQEAKIIRPHKGHHKLHFCAASATSLYPNPPQIWHSRAPPFYDLIKIYLSYLRVLLSKASSYPNTPFSMASQNLYPLRLPFPYLLLPIPLTCNIFDLKLCHPVHITSCRYTPNVHPQQQIFHQAPWISLNFSW